MQLIIMDSSWHFFTPAKSGPRTGMAIAESSVPFESFLQPLMVRGHISDVKYFRDGKVLSPKEAFELIDSDENIDDLEVHVTTFLDIVTLSKFARMWVGKHATPKKGVPVKKFERPTSKKEVIASS